MTTQSADRLQNRLPRLHNRTMRYWWASQGKNYQHVTQQGGLWTCPSATGHSRPDRELIQQLAAGDLVFHYARKQLRAISEVENSWVPRQRPPHYSPKPGEGDDGWFVETVPILRELAIPLSELAELIGHGSPGPLDVNGRPMQKYLSELEPGDAASLLQLVQADIHSIEGLGAPGGDITWTGSSTSFVREALARREQSALRRHLLEDRSHAICALCGRELPAGLLVAAHIVPRSRLAEEERRELSRIAMLACVLGCDALFEHGYIAVDDSGLVHDLPDPGLPDVRAFTKRIAGHHCSAHTSATAGRFAEHFARAQYLQPDN